MKLPIALIRTVWPPNEGLMPGNERFDAMFASVRRDGILQPLTINLDWTLIDGHHRLSAARLLGFDAVEVRVWTGTEFIPAEEGR